MATEIGPEKSGSKVPKSPAKTPIANGQLLMHGDRMQGEFDFDMRSVHCAWNFDRTEHKELACPIGVLAGFLELWNPISRVPSGHFLQFFLQNILK